MVEVMSLNTCPKPKATFCPVSTGRGRRSWWSCCCRGCLSSWCSSVSDRSPSLSNRSYSPPQFPHWSITKLLQPVRVGTTKYNDYCLYFLLFVFIFSRISSPTGQYIVIINRLSYTVRSTRRTQLVEKRVNQHTDVHLYLIPVINVEIIYLNSRMYNQIRF